MTFVFTNRKFDPKIHMELQGTLSSQNYLEKEVQREVKCIHIGKEDIKLPLFIDDMIVPAESPKELSK